MSEVNDFLAKYPAPTRQRLEQIRHIIKSESPQLTEGLKWGKLAYSNEVIMVMVDAYTNYISLHVTKTTIASLKDELTSYKTTAGSVQFPNDKPIPDDIVKKVLRYRIDEYEKKGVLWK